MNTNYKDSLLNPYKTNKITIYIFFFLFFTEMAQLAREQPIWVHKAYNARKKTSKKLLVKYTIIIIDVLLIKSYVI